MRNGTRHLTLYYVNINGFTSKSISLKDIIHELNNPDVIVLCEIKSVSTGVIRNFFKLLGYDIIVKKASGMVLATKFKFDMVNVTTTAHDNIVSGSLKMGSTYVTVIGVYGPQENEVHEKREEFYDELGIEIQACYNRGNRTIVAGDFNSKIMCSEGNIVSESPNGSLLSELIEQFSMEVLNFKDVCIGKWTRVQEKAEGVERSVIDYVITDKRLSECMTEILIDEEKVIAPFWIRCSKKKGKVRQHSDHNSFYVKFNLPWTHKEEEVNNENSEDKGWKITNEGIIEFSKSTDEMDKINMEEGLTTFKEHLTHIMDSCFRKKKKAARISHPNVNKEHVIFHKPLITVMKIIAIYLKRGKTEKSAARRYIVFIQDLQNKIFQQNKAKIVAQVMTDVQDGKGDLAVDKFWKLRKSMSCPDTTRSSIITRNNIELFSGPAIIKEYENEFSNRLAHKSIDGEFQRYEKITNNLFEEYLKSSKKCNEEPDFTVKEVKGAIKTLRSDSAPGPDHIPPGIFIHAGNGLIAILTDVFNFIKNSLLIPPEWFEMIIVTIFKNKGSRKMLEYYRGVFLANVITKIFEKLIKKRVNPQLSQVNLLQAGSRSNRSTCDNLYLLNGIIDHAKYLNNQLFLTFYDYSTCFDSLWLEDSMISLWDIGIRNELFALIFKLNEHTKIRVRTPHGMSAYFECPRIVKQGSVLSSNLCSTSTGELCSRNDAGGVSMGTLLINDILYVDDTTDTNTDINETIASHNEIVNFAKSKRLKLNHTKCCIIAINKKATGSVPTLQIGDGHVQQVKNTKFLGDIVNEKGTNTDMVEDRVKKGNAALINCLAVCNEVTMGAFFVKTAMILYNSVFLAVILFNSQAWTNMSKTDTKKLQTLQLKYLKRVMRAPYSTSNSFVYLELGILPISYHIHIRQLCFLHHIVKLCENDPVRRMYEEQKSLPYEKNWTNNVVSLLKHYGLHNEKIEELSKESWKEKVKNEITKKAFDNLTKEAKEKSKTKLLHYTSFSPQPYLFHYQPKEASTIFKLRSKTTECKANRKSTTTDLTCRLCRKEEENQEHVVNCSKIRRDGTTYDINEVIGEEGSLLNDTNIHEICNRFYEFSRLINEVARDQN